MLWGMGGDSDVNVMGDEGDSDVNVVGDGGVIAM